MYERGEGDAAGPLSVDQRKGLGGPQESLGLAIFQPLRLDEGRT